MNCFLSPSLAVKKPEQFGITVNVRYSVTKNESIARQFPAQSQRCAIKKKSYYVHLSSGTNCYTNNTTEFLNEAGPSH